MTLLRAEQARDYARKALSEGSSNLPLATGAAKQNLHGPLGLRTYMVPKLRNECGDDLADFYHRLACMARFYQAGNCEEMAAVAFEYLRDRGVRRIAIAQTSREQVDHVLVLIGDQFPGNMEERLVTAFVGCFVCDPWAEIACPVNDYADDWHRSMSGWLVAAPNPEGGTWMPSSTKDAFRTETITVVHHA
jgi:hypothetical protein